MDESAWITAARRGDREAFNRLVVHYQDLAYNVAYRIMGDPDVAADATQDAFISAYQALSGFRGGSFRSWLLRIVTNACYDVLRARKRRPTVSLDADAELDWEEWTEGDEEAPENYAERQDLGHVIQLGLQELPEEQRTVIVLSDVHGMAYDEIAKTLGISLGTVKSRLSRGREKMREFLQASAELLPARYRLYSEGGGAAGLTSLFIEWLTDGLWVRWLRRGASRHG